LAVNNLAIYFGGGGLLSNYIDKLIYDLNYGDEKARAFAAEDIILDEIPEGIQLLIDRLVIESSRYVREVIVNCLQEIKSRDLIAKVVPLLSSDDAFIRNASIEIISAQGELAIEFIKSIQNDANKDVRKFALDILFQLKGFNTGPLIAVALNDPDINNQITAVEYLGLLEDTSCTDMINELFMATDNILLRCTCLEALASIANEKSIHCINKVYPSYKDISLLEQYSFLKFIARQGTDSHLPFILSLIKDKGQVMHKEIINALRGILTRNPRPKLPADLLFTLIAYLKTDIPVLSQYELLVLMGNYRNQEIYHLLIDYLNNEETFICMGAVEGLGLYGNCEALPLLTALKDKVDDYELSETIEQSIAKLSK